LCWDRAGRLWAGTNRGLIRWQHGRFTALDPADGPGSIQVGAIHEDREGAVWVGTSGKGVYRFTGDRVAAYCAARRGSIPGSRGGSRAYWGGSGRRVATALDPPDQVRPAPSQ
jgi:hypothetical protein